MRVKEAESERLKGEERTLLEQQAELERLDAERTRLADERRKREHGSASLLHIVQTVQIAKYFVFYMYTHIVYVYFLFGTGLSCVRF